MTTARTYGGAGALLSALLLPVLGQPPAVAAGAPQLGALYVDPPTGGDSTPLDLVTTGGCPAPATNVVGRLFGKGFPASGQIVVGNTDAGVSRSGSFTAVPADTLRAFAAMQSTPAALNGSYRIVLSCQEALGSGSLGDYVGTLVFDGPRSYVARNPATKPVPVVDPGPGAGGVPLPTGPAASQQPVPGSPTTVAPKTAAGTLDAAAGQGLDDSGSLAPILGAGLGGFALAAGLFGLSRLTRRPRTARSAVT